MSVFQTAKLRILTGTTDDAAAAGEVLAAGGLYQATVDEIDDGDLGRLRATKRRSLVMSPDQRLAWAYKTTVAYAGDIEQSTTAPQTGYSAAATTFFDGADGSFDANIRYVRLPMAHWNAASIMVTNQLTSAIDLTLQVWIHLTGATAEVCVPVLETTLLYGKRALLASQPAGYGAGDAGGDVVYVPLLASPCAYIVVGVTPSADPSGGWWGVFTARR